jgi:DNA-binding beta-propeller fold protein YncE
MRAGLVALAVLLIAGAGVGGYFIGKGNKSKSKSTAFTTSTSPPVRTGAGNTVAADVQGFVYVESNIAKPNANTIIAYQYRGGGDLHPLKIAEYPTGGAGSADLTDSGVLDADQHLLVSPDNKLLFAVNQGSDTIAVFHVGGDGSLTPAPGSPYPSGGKGPASVGLSGNHVIVVNKAQDGVRDLSKVNPVYASFNLQSDGSLQPTGSSFKAPPGFSPTQAQISTDGKVVMSTEEGGPLRAFTIGTDGKLTQGPNSPQSIPNSLYPASVPPKLRWALGLGVHPTQQILFAQLATIGKMGVYRYDDSARLTFVKAVPDTGAMLNCWTLVNKGGSRVYTADAGNNTVGVFDTSDPLNPKQIQLLHLKGNGNPWDIRLDPTGKFIFLDDPRARMNVAPGQGNEIHTLLVGADGKVTEAPSSPASIPVPLNVNPIGMAVVPRA